MNSSRRSRKNEQSPNLHSGWELSLIVSLFLCRLLVPTEAAEQGLTIWICSLTFLSAAVIFFLRYRNEQTPTYRPALPDLAVLLMVLGHLASGFYVLNGHGNQRSAVNMMWEWTSIGAYWILVRLFLTGAGSRRILTTALIMTVASLSLLGLWQHYVWYPQQAAGFSKLAEYNASENKGQSLSIEEQQDYKALITEYGTDFLTLDEPGRIAFLARVRDSVEPIGLFVLANTFALFVAAALLLLLFDFAERNRSLTSVAKMILAILAVILVFCLVLTKSRTAWVGSVVGVGFYFLLRWFAVRSALRVNPKYVAVSMLVFSALLAWMAFSGGIDVEVISEAPKSLKYRLEYWHSTIQLLQDKPLLGAGPGNFRQHYLQYKLPGSSEEILDPHNLFLGIWAGGGLLALAGLVLLILSGLSRGLRADSDVANAKSVPELFISFKDSIRPIVIAYCLTTGLTFLLEGGLDQRLLVMGGLTWGLSTLGCWFGCQLSVTSLSAVSVWIAAMVHLLGASGIEMPAVVVLLLVLVHFSQHEEHSEARQYQLPQKSLLAGCLISGALVVGSLLTGLIPVQVAQTDVRIGESMLLVQRNSQLAKRYFQNAIEADPISPEPHQRLAMLIMSEWERSGGRDESDFKQAVEQMEEAIQLDPIAAGRYRILGNFWDRKSINAASTEDATQAVKAYQQAAKLYPNFAEIQAELAIAQVRAEQDAQSAAKKALQLDQLNRDNGHRDKFLSDEVREQLMGIAEAQ